MSSNLDEQIKLLALDLPSGFKTQHLVCPSCMGGAGGERSFIIFRAEGGTLHYKCYRAKCGIKGSTGSKAPPFGHKKKEFVPAAYSGSLVTLPKAVYEEHLEKFEIPYLDFLRQRTKYNVERKTVVFPIMSTRGYEVGVVDRDYSNGRSPKALSYWFRDVEKIYIPSMGGTYFDKLFVVEDIVSALKIVAAGGYAVALLGTYLGNSEAILLSKYTRELIFWLDSNAVHVAYSLQKKYRLLFDEIKVYYTVDDPKDVPMENVANIVRAL